MKKSFAARGATLSAFERRCIASPPQRGCRVGDPGSGCVAPPSNIPDILGRSALPAGRIAALGATMDLHRGLLAAHGAGTPAVVAGGTNHPNRLGSPPAVS